MENPVLSPSNPREPSTASLAGFTSRPGGWNLGPDEFAGGVQSYINFACWGTTARLWWFLMICGKVGNIFIPAGSLNTEYFKSWSVAEQLAEQQHDLNASPNLLQFQQNVILRCCYSWPFQRVGSQYFRMSLRWAATGTMLRIKGVATFQVIWFIWGLGWVTSCNFPASASTSIVKFTVNAKRYKKQTNAYLYLMCTQKDVSTHHCALKTYPLCTTRFVSKKTLCSLEIPTASRKPRLDATNKLGMFGSNGPSQMLEQWKSLDTSKIQQIHQTNRQHNISISLYHFMSALHPSCWTVFFMPFWSMTSYAASHVNLF